MTSFRFNFGGDSAYPAKNNIDDKTLPKNNEETFWLASELVVPSIQKDDLDKNIPHARMFVCGDVQIGHVVVKDALLRMGDNKLKSSAELAEEEHTDLVPGKYEGGLKIWECTYDLIEYLELQADQQFKHLKVLDLGCGAGILGIYAFKKGANVTFQDYNQEVLKCVTIPNILLNLEEEDDRDINECQFYSGDWASFNRDTLSDSVMFDLILTSETIYNPDNYGKVIDLFLQRLKKDGTVYVAAKTCYFGVGGGTREFEKNLSNHPLLKSEVCWKSVGGIQREILRITRNQD